MARSDKTRTRRQHGPSYTAAGGWSTPDRHVPPSTSGPASNRARASTSGGVAGEKVAESWNKKSKVWSGICKIDLKSVSVADHVFQISITGLGGETVLSPETRFVKLAQ